MKTLRRLFVAIAFASVAGAQSLTPAQATRAPDKKDLAAETVQLNVRNALNHYRVWVVPTSALGTTLNARFSAQPRMFIWTNMLNF